MSRRVEVSVEGSVVTYLTNWVLMIEKEQSVRIHNTEHPHKPQTTMNKDRYVSVLIQ